MLGALLIVVIAALTLISGENSSPMDNTTLQQRSGRFFPLFSIVRFANSECSGTNAFNGTCFTRKECANYGGSIAGTCANKLGVCCTFRKECGTITNSNNTYFVNPNYYSSYQGGERCMITVYPCTTDICQLRLDFLEFSLSQPNASGVCDNDFLLIAGAARTYPRICGENAGQHVYVEFNGANPIIISIDTNVDYSFARKWNLRIQQIGCDSPWQAPNGCLQYYNMISGTVTSFNYGTTTNPRLPLNFPFPGTRQIQNLNYGVCIDVALGYCGIEWSQLDSNSFSISGDSGNIDSAAGIDSSVSGAECDHNYVIIPNPFADGIRYTTDRFCGNAFQTKTSSTTPFVLTVVTNPDPNENAPSSPIAIQRDIGNRGFTLKYRQITCAV
ncbi:hypothetical protein PV328_001371 [Microctonus aethiopoides]|uniref:CUB domain-containing protein n=1 Tax=Microctonus aethiopoides TaxID=144406 RepID=A0AA39FX23_9HYME|nr:hypothetical protein PV328_001371 [Microctonus aethiopoides]